MENEEDLIRDKMEETRTSLSEKVEELENKVVDTVKGATGTVQGTVEAVRDTVQEAKQAVAGTVETIKETVQQTIGAVKQTVKGGVDLMKDLLNIPLQTQRHPWLVMGGSVLTGFCLGKLLAPPRARKAMTEGMAVASAPEAPVATRAPLSHNGGHRKGEMRAGKSFLQGVLSRFGPEIAHFKNVAIGMMIQAVRDTVSKNLPQEFAPQVAGILDSISAKLTGPESAEDAAHQGESQEERHHARAGNRHRKFDRR